METRGSRFVVTGGASLIGSHIADQLLAGGAREVVLFDNYSLSSPDVVREQLRDARVRLVKGDITRVNELYDALEDVDGVFAVAGFLTLPLSQNPALGLDVNIRGHMNVLDTCRYRRVKKVVFSSSIAVYGDPEPGLIDEDAAYRSHTMGPATVLYAASKMVGENLCKLYEERYGIKSVSLRYATVYGERQHYRGINALYIIDTYDKLVRGERPRLPGDGSEVHDYVHVADVARANVMAMESEVSGESFNVASGKATSLRRLFEIIARQIGSDLQPVYAEGDGLRLTTSSTLDFSIDKIGRMIGWTPQVSIEDGIERLIRWRRGQSA
ncbi:NAD-dependent epimerase/dehydratase family protein [Mesorhizobium sp. 1B3]|uniref:NAD-dependent epimerase/dehydratase family protein n=1 Tax=Mesorhizobium sp. 1B3 TaxID=3243599 RepID=UPI003D986575